MSENTTNDSGVDGRTAFIRGLVEMLSDSPERTVPMATTDVGEVIKGQLTENTGRHLLDSGFYGRNWEENRDSPPWEAPEWQVSGSSRNIHNGYVVKNLFHHLAMWCGRDETAVALEVALYQFGRSSEFERTPWLRTAEAFADALAEPHYVEDWVREYQVPRDVAERLPHVDDSTSHFTANTYNSEYGDLTQVIQIVGFGGPYAEYTAVQVHGGADVRGGYTAPRVYRAVPAELLPSEFQFGCDRFEWWEAESCVRDDTRLLWQSTLDPDELVEEGYVDPEDAADHPAIVEAREAEHIDGAVFYHDEERDDIGHVTFR